MIIYLYNHLYYHPIIILLKMNMNIDMIIANENARIIEAMESLKAKIISSISEPGYVDIKDINVESFADNVLKGLEQDMKEMQENALKHMIVAVEGLKAKIISCLPEEACAELRSINVASLAMSRM